MKETNTEKSQNKREKTELFIYIQNMEKRV